VIKLTSEVKTIIPLLPFIILSISALILLLFTRVKSLENLSKLLALLSGLGSFIALFFLPKNPMTILNYSFIHDGLTLSAEISVLIAIIFTVLTGFEYEKRLKRKPEYYALLLFSSAGMLVLAGGGSLISIFVGLELTSLPLYILAGFMRDDEASFEAGVKYFLLGSFASAIFLMGIAFTFGGTGFVLLKDITAKVSSEGPSLIIYAGYIFLIGGLFFKIAIVPFHIWAPDVYQGSPSPVAGFMSVAVKASAFPVLIRLMNGVFHSLSPVWEQTIYTFSIITVIWGSLLGIVQEDFKRLLGYSSIVHAGFILIALLNTLDGGKSAAFYIIIYTMMNIGAFGVVTSLSTENAERTSIESLRGLFTRDPFIAFMLLIFAFSLAGIPPTAGFWAKFYVFKSAIGAGYILPVIILLLGAVVALYYYLKVLIYSFFYSPSNNEPLEKRWVLRLSLLLLSIKILYFGIYPKHLIKFLSISPFAILGK